ncbi:MAG: hypothetical protein GXY08_12240 [Ruminococcus sp.]|nr:hypothetical protein [Ruminococcus sp.]
MKPNKIISAALILGITFTFTGCGSSDSSSASSSEASSSEAKPAGFTTAELASKISIDGHQLKTPMTFADLGDDFTLDSYVQEGDPISMINIFNNDGIVCALGYYCSPEEVNENRNIDCIIYTANDFNRGVISIDGFTANDNVEKLEEKLGKPERDGIYFYEATDGGKLEVIDVLGKVSSINFFFEQPEKK